jgi:hypothetical protein
LNCPQRKAAYHAWATMTSPLLLAFLVTLEEAARRRRTHAARTPAAKSLPIIRRPWQTIRASARRNRSAARWFEETLKRWRNIWRR